MKAHRFGWLPESDTLRCAAFIITPDDGERDPELLSPRIHDGWYYPPLEPEWFAANDIGNRHISFAPWFALPSTHTITFKEDAEKSLATFVISTLGLLKGMQLVPQGWGHFYRTPVELGKLTDFRCAKAAARRILNLAHEFWSTNESVRMQMFGAMNWHLFGRSYEHAFEEFGAAYAVLDSCWNVHKRIEGVKERLTHAERIIRLCERYELAVPTWATINGKASRLSLLRNEYFHESLWGGQPIGLGHPDDVPGIHLELSWFNTRLLLALLGERSSYTRSQIRYVRQVLK